MPKSSARSQPNRTRLARLPGTNRGGKECLRKGTTCCVSLEGTSCEPSSARLHATQWLAALQRRTSADKHSGRRDARVCSCRAGGVRKRVGGGGREACGGASGAQRGTSGPGRSSRSSRAAESDRGRRGGPAWWSPATMSGLARGRIRRPRGAVPGAPTADLARRVPRAGCVWAGGVLCSVTFRAQTPARRCRSCERSQGSQPHILAASISPQDWSEKKASEWSCTQTQVANCPARTCAEKCDRELPTSHT